jgi:IMP dehydrogenase/GMP reductase
MKDFRPQFDFDDVLIVPKIKTHINSRYNGIELASQPPYLQRYPLFTAPMDTVVDENNYRGFIDAGINVTLPRTIKHSDFDNKLPVHGVFISMGFDDLDHELKTSLRNLREDAHILIDVANGHMQKVFDYAREIKRLRPDIILMVGNIGNPETYKFYAKGNCVDYIRVGIGNGGGCLTTKQSGVGYPMASLIYETRRVKELLRYENPELKLPAIVADGGMKDYSDIIKALGLGADYVMIGSIFNKCLESCAQNYLYGIKINKKFATRAFKKGLPVKKYFRGMSTKGAQKAMGKTSFKTSEGVTRFRRVEYRLSGWVENFEHYLRNAMSYSNAKTLNNFIGNVEICQITTRAYDRFNK